MKKPDNVSDNPGLLPYASNVGAPVIQIENIDLWKQRGIHKVNRQLETKFLELKEEYHKLVEEYKWNDLVYNAKFSFEPFYDYGFVRNSYIDNKSSGRLSGLGIKTIFNHKYLNSSLTYSKGLGRSNMITSPFKEHELIYFEIAAMF